MSVLALPKSLLVRFSVEVDDYPAAMSWSGDGRWLALGTAEGDVLLIDVEQGRCRQRWQAHEYGLHQLSWHPNRWVLATSGQDGCARLWQVADDAAVHKLGELDISAAPGANAWVEQLTWRKDGAQLALAAGRAIQVYNADGALQAQWQFTGSTVAALDWRPKGAMLAAAGYGAVALYTPLDPNARAERLAWKGSLLNVNWSPDARVIAAGCQDNSVHFWYVKDRQDSMMSGFESRPKVMSWSRNSRWLAVGGSTEITGWAFDGRGPEGREPVCMSYHPKTVSALAFASKGNALLAGCSAGQVSVWSQVGSPAPAAALRMPSAVELVAWSPGKMPLAAAVSRCGRLSVW